MLFRKAILIIHGFAGGTYDSEDLANELNLVAYCAKVNNRIRELSYVVKKDCDIEF